MCATRVPWERPHAGYQRRVGFVVWALQVNRALGRDARTKQKHFVFFSKK